MNDRKKWSTLLLLLFLCCKAYSQQVSYTLNGDSVNYYNPNVEKDQLLEVHVELEQSAFQYDKIFYEFYVLESQEEKTIASLGVSGLNLKTAFPDGKVTYKVFERKAGQEDCGIQGLYPYEFLGHDQHSIQMGFRMSGKQEVGTVSEWHCGPNCYSECNRNCRGGFLSSYPRYGRSFILTNQQHIRIKQVDKWIKVKREKDRAVERILKKYRRQRAAGVFLGTLCGLVAIIVRSEP